MSVRLAIVNDIHHGKDGFSKKASKALDIFEDFARFANDAKPDLVLDLGDRINDQDAETDRRLAKDVAEAFRGIQTPVHHICGNHDLDFLDVADNEEILGQTLTSEAIDIGDWRLLIWRADAKYYRPLGFVMPELDLIWLQAEIAKSTKPIAIFTHVPPTDVDVRGNYWFANNPHSLTYANPERIRAVIESAKTPVVCISGHVHLNSFCRINGVAYATLQSLSETFTTIPEPARAWTLLELGQDIACQTFGNDAMSWRLPAEQTARRWLPKLPSFADNPEVKLRTRKS